MRILEESIFTRFDVRGNPEKNPAEGTVFIARKARMNPQLKKGAMAEGLLPEGTPVRLKEKGLGNVV